MKSRVISPNFEALKAMRFIREFCLDQNQIAYRYTVDQIDLMCAEVGLEPIDGEVEADKVQRLCAALYVNNCYGQKVKKLEIDYIGSEISFTDIR